ncbi:MAG: hypothetical protein P4L46_01190 [Fimbriimonas sp.]|nr:hypothetical protein [Fimbriimonas sp.]
MGLLDDLGHSVRKQGAPFTVALIASVIASALFLSVSRGISPEDLVLWNGSLSHPWTFLTYVWTYAPFGSGMGLITFAFLLIWLFQCGGSLEREMGTAKLAAFWFVSILVASAALFLAAAIAGYQLRAAGPYLALATVTVAWSVRNQSASVMLYGVVPFSGKLIGWATALLVLFGFGIPNPLMGIAACVPLELTFLFASDRIPGLAFTASGPYRSIGRRRFKGKEATTRGQVMYDQAYFDDVQRREQERDERERLRKLLGEDE